MTSFRLSCLLLTLILCACAMTGGGHTPDPNKTHLTLRDVFVYTCQYHYMRTHGIPRFDASYELAGQTVSVKGHYVITLSNMAKQFALKIPAPDYTDMEHGVPAVLAACKVESHGPDVERVLQEAARDVD